MTIKELKELREERRKYWDDLRENNPEEYERKRKMLKQMYDRWQAETDAMSEDENESPE
jgi:hypothetical protein